MSASPEFLAARGRGACALRQARQAFEEMLDLVDPIGSDHDDLAELLLALSSLADLYKSVRPEVEAGALGWLALNANGIRAVTAGDLKYWGEKEKVSRCADVGECAAAMAHIRLERPLLVVAGGGGESAIEEFWLGLRDFFREVVSANGLKEGASRKLLESEAEQALRDEVLLNPAAVELLPGEIPARALERAVEAAREAAYAAHWQEDWPDKLKGGDPKTKLGVGNLRFVLRVGGGTKKELEEMERERLAAQAGEVAF